MSSMACEVIFRIAATSIGIVGMLSQGILEMLEVERWEGCVVARSASKLPLAYLGGTAVHGNAAFSRMSD